VWSRLDDVIMGGRSISGWDDNIRVNNIDDNDKEYSIFRSWTGNVNTIDGGFCGTIANNITANIRGYDGVRIVVRGDGYRYKVGQQVCHAASPVMAQCV
jgi:Complex I intermediate-associated protein 30 (CIA30)